MPSEKQNVGDKGERFIAKTMACLSCKREKTLKQLPNNFKCADLICDFCGHTSQVKTFRSDQEGLPKAILGAAWQPQKDRMDAGIFHALWIVRMDSKARCKEVWLASSEAQKPEMFVKRKPLSDNAKRAGWQGFLIDTANYNDRFIKMK